MAGLAAVIRWDDDLDHAEQVGRMLDALAHRGPDGRGVLSGQGWSLGFLRFPTTPREHTEVQPYHDRQRHLWVVADSRLDNRSELGRQLGAGVDPEIGQVLALGYERWGTSLPERLAGDFAFVLWDEVGGR